MALHFLYTTPADPLAQPLVDELRWEYERRYGEFFAASGEPREMDKYADAIFTPAQGGSFVLLLDDAEPVSGGAFKRHGPYTAELKRVWTHSRRRRQGLAQRVVAELEAQAWRQGYRSIYLTTGFRQPEAVALYRRAGYAALYDADGDLQAQRKLPFRKDLTDLEVTRYADSTAEARA